MGKLNTIVRAAHQNPPAFDKRKGRWRTKVEFGNWDSAFGNLDGIVGNWESVFGVWDGVFGI